MKHKSRSARRIFGKNAQAKRIEERAARACAFRIGCCFAVLIGLSGCGGSSSSRPIPPPQNALIAGKVLGGQQPVQNSEIQLYAAGSSGYGRGEQLLTPPVYTDSNGDFSISGDFTCPSASTPVYLISSGGDPGIGANNPAIEMMAALGPCGSLGSTPIVVNEVTTVASVWALAPFLGVGGKIGTSAGNAKGLANAFASVNSLVDISKGAAPGPGAPQNAVVPAKKIYTLADILAACVNAPGETCKALFKAATPSGGAAPANTLDAAVNIARNPAANIAALFDLLTPQSPFQPTLNSAPPDWLLALNFSGGGLNSPGSIALDAQGNVWAANYFISPTDPLDASVSELSNTGQPISPDGGFTGGGLSESYGLTVDANGSVWTTNEASQQVNGQHGTVTVMNSAGQVTSGPAGYFGGGVDFPVAIAADTDGSVWTANYGDSTATRLSASGAALSGSSGFGDNELLGPVAVAIDAAHNAWFANQSSESGSVTGISPNGSQVTTIDCGGEEPSGIATDAVTGGGLLGHVWTANFASSTVSEIELGTDGSATVVSTGYTGGGLDHPNGIAVDGAGSVWVTNFKSTTITELRGAASATPGKAASPAGGFGQDAQLLEPYAVAIDAAGSVWVSNFGLSTLTEFVGAAVPVKTPLTGPAGLP